MELKDGGIPVSVTERSIRRPPHQFRVYSKDISIISVKIGNDFAEDDISKYKEDFEHLFNYLKSEKYICQYNDVFSNRSVISYESSNKNLGSVLAYIESKPHFNRIFKNNKVNYINLVFVKK